MTDKYRYNSFIWPTQFIVWTTIIWYIRILPGYSWQLLNEPDILTTNRKVISIQLRPIDRVYFSQRIYMRIIFCSSLTQIDPYHAILIWFSICKIHLNICVHWEEWHTSFNPSRVCVTWLLFYQLTHWSLNKMADVLLVRFSNTLHWYTLWLKFH